jgi:DNA polymerase-3 subunit beta
MIIDIDRDLFLQMLQTVGQIVPLKPIIPSLAGVFLQADNNQVRLTSNNLELSISIVGEATVSEPGEVLIPARMLTEAVRRSPSERVVLKQLTGRSAVSFQSGSVHMEILTLPLEEFPELPQFSLQHTYTLPQPLFKDMMRQVSFAISSEELRPVLTGALLSFNREDVRLTALDGFKLACRWSSYLKSDQEAQAIVPGKAIRDLLKLLGDTEPLEIGIGENYASFEFSGARLITRLLEGKFPDIQQFIPKQYQTQIVVGTEELWQAIERAALVCKTGTAGSVKFNISEGQIAVSAQSMELGRHYETIPVQHAGEDLEIMYNIRSFIEVLRSAQAPEVVIDFHGTYGPCICRPLGQDDYFSLLMPVRLT